jgi:hypothetical protein
MRTLAVLIGVVVFFGFMATAQFSGEISLVQFSQSWQTRIIFTYNTTDDLRLTTLWQRTLGQILEDQVDLGLSFPNYLRPYIELEGGISFLENSSRLSGFYYRTVGNLSRGEVSYREYFFFEGERLGQKMTELWIVSSTKPGYSLWFSSRVTPGVISQKEKNLHFSAQLLPWLAVGIQISESRRWSIEDDRVKDLEDTSYLVPYIEGKTISQVSIKGRLKWIVEFDALSGESQPLGWAIEEEISFKF